MSLHFFRRTKRRMISTILAAAMFSTLLITGCSQTPASNQNKAFQMYTKNMFCQEVSSNSISLHYTLRNPEEYNISNAPITFGRISADRAMAGAALENAKEALGTYSFEKLSNENQLTYEILSSYLEQSQEGLPFLLYQEPLSQVSGIQTQLPVLLSEYQFYNKEDIETYLQLMQTTPDYFKELIAFEKMKSEAGLFMADYSAQTVMDQCNAFIEMGESNYLVSTFVDRIEQVEGLSMEEKGSYIQKNAQMLNLYIIPAYHDLVAAVQSLMGTGKNEKGLCFLPEGKKYYEYVAGIETGSKKTIKELQELTRQQIISDLEAMEEVLRIAGTQTKETISMTEMNPVTMLADLESRIEKVFPSPPETTTQIKYVPKAMEEHLSPAFYMIPAIDNTTENVIYVNPSHIDNTMTLYTTLAHEGYPGHLYQTIYYADKNPDPLRSVLNFGGYVEGWATYAEMCSYYFMPVSKEQATLLQKNSSIILGLYALADMGIHYEGWSRLDTVAFFKNYGIKDTETIEQIYELIIGDPGNYLKYYIGYVEFLELKKEWLQENKKDFSQKEFHEAVLSVGPAPFELVEEYMK